MLEDYTFLHLRVNSETDLAQVEASFLADGDNNKKSEVRLSIGDGSFFEQPDGVARTAQLVALLKTLFRVETRIEKITFDSGVSGDSNLLPLEAIAVALAEGALLTRLDLSYVKVVCPRNAMELLLQSLLMREKTRSLRQCCLDQALLVESQRDASILRQCCLDRALLVEYLRDNGEVNDNPPPPQEQQQAEEEFSTLPLDALISLFVHGCPQLEWLTVCSDEFCTLKIETLQLLSQAPNLQELSLWNFDLRSATHTTAFFNALANNHQSQLVRLTFPTTLSISGAQAVARYLKQVPALGRTFLQGLTLTLNCFVHDDNVNSSDTKEEESTSTSTSTTTNIIQDEATKQKIIGVIVDALRVNQSLQSFRLRGSANINTAKLKHTFANMLRHNYTLQYFSILNRDTITTTTTATEDGNNNNRNDSISVEDSAANIELYLKLNRYGRRKLFYDEDSTGESSKTNSNFNDKEKWLEVMAETRNDVNCLFYLLQTNPSLCTGAGR